MGANLTTELKRPLKRRLRAIHGKAPWFVSLDPDGSITLWPSRHRKVTVDVPAIYFEALEREREKGKVK